MKLSVGTLVLAYLAWKLFLEKKPDPRGNVEIGEPTIGSKPGDWEYPFPDDKGLFT